MKLLTPAEFLAAAATIPPLPYVPGELGADSGRDEERLSDRDSDLLACREEDRMWRQWP